MTEENRIFNAALAVRSARAVDDYVGSIRMAHQEMQQTTIETTQALRDEMAERQLQTSEMQLQTSEMQERTLEAMQAMIDQMAQLMTFLADRLSEPVVVNLPETRLRMDQQPVTVNVPKAVIQVNPVINAPKPSVVIEKAESKLPKRITIKHSDGTQSTIEITK